MRLLQFDASVSINFKRECRNRSVIESMSLNHHNASTFAGSKVDCVQTNRNRPNTRMIDECSTMR